MTNSGLLEYRRHEHDDLHHEPKQVLAQLPRYPRLGFVTSAPLTSTTFHHNRLRVCRVQQQAGQNCLVYGRGRFSLNRRQRSGLVSMDGRREGQNVSKTVLGALSRLRFSRRWVYKGYNNVMGNGVVEKLWKMMGRVGLVVVAMMFGMFGIGGGGVGKVTAGVVGVQGVSGAGGDTGVREIEVGRAVRLLGVGAVVVAGVKVLQWGRKGRSQEEEVRRAEVESEKLQKEEEERMRGRERRKLEGVGGYGVGISAEEEEMWGDDVLREKLKKRMEKLEKGEEDEEDAEDKRNMRYKPIPDRGMGSMLLDRPGDGDEDKEEDEEESEVPASAASVEMLKRMWSLNDGEDQSSKKSAKDGGK